MKAFIVILATAFSFSANAYLESYFGKLQQSGLDWQCSYTNDTGGTLNFKRVVFTLTPTTGEGLDFTLDEAVNLSVAPGEVARGTVTSAVQASGGTCHFLAN